MNFRVKLLEDYVCAAEENKTGFLSVGVDIIDQLYLKEQPISLPMVLVHGYNRWRTDKKLTFTLVIWYLLSFNLAGIF